MKLSIIIPCRNEERRLGATLDRICTYLATQTYEAEVIVVDNGSADRTRDVAWSRRDRFEHFLLVEENRGGKGWAVRQGMLLAQGQRRLFTDADNSTDIAQVALLMEAIDAGAQVAASSRRAPGASIVHPQPWHRRALGDAFAALVGALAPVGVSDTQNGFKMFTDRAAMEIFPRISTFRWAFDIEVLAIARALDLKIVEVPITWVNDEQSTMTLGGMFGMLVDVLKTRRRIRRGELVKIPSEQAIAEALA